MVFNAQPNPSKLKDDSTQRIWCRVAYSICPAKIVCSELTAALVSARVEI